LEVATSSDEDYLYVWKVEPVAAPVPST